MKSDPTSKSKPEVLVLQTCRLPSLLFCLKRIQAAHPDWQIEARVEDERQVRELLDRLALNLKLSCRRQAGTSKQNLQGYHKVILPLLNRGFLGMKRAALAGGAPLWEADYEGRLRPLKRSRLRKSLVVPLHEAPPEMAEFLQRFPLTPLGRRVLWVESCHPSLSSKVQDNLEGLIPADAQVTRVESGPLRSFLGTVIRLRRERFDGAVVFFSGEVGFGRHKLLPFLVGIRRILVVRETGVRFYLSARKLFRFWYERLCLRWPQAQAAPRILLVQTETAEYVRQVLLQLRKDKLFPRSEIAVLCAPGDQTRLKSILPPDCRLLPYSNRRWKDNLRLWKQLQDFDADVACAIFTGWPIFRKQKLFYLLYPVRRRLIFNARLDFFDLHWRNLPRLWRREPRLFAATEARRLLFVQTADSETMLRALGRLSQSEVTEGGKIVVFCREDQGPLFRKQPHVQGVITYPAGGLPGKLKAAWKLRGTRYDLVTGIFTGRPTFTLHKLLLLTLLGGPRLIFNRHLDFDFLRAGNFLRVLFQNRFENSGPSSWRVPVKLLLFLPRFLFLVIWITILRLRPPYTWIKPPEETPERES